MVGPYERLSLLLAEIIRSGDTPTDVGWRAGQQYRSSAQGADDVISSITEAMTRMGFDPEVRRRGKRIEVVLGSCPFVSAALADPGTICSLHLGLAQGLAEGTCISVDSLVAKDPRRADCRLRLREQADV